MSGRAWALVLVGLALVGAWYSPWSPRVPAPPAPAPGTIANCPLPPAVTTGAAPLQTPVPGGMPAFALAAATLTPLAGFSVDARVLSREDYHLGREADLSPTDLALGWGRMREDAVLDHLDIGQAARWYRYRWRGDPPIPLAEIVRSSANMHMIPADGRVARTLARIRRGDRVRIDGWLVRADTTDDWHWQSSLSRDDTGNGACELVYVCALRRE
jgi:hypothetical protein